MTLIRGRVKIHRKKQVKAGREYVFYQGVIYIKKEYLDKLTPLDGKEVTLFLEGEEIRKESDLEKALVTLFTKAFNDEKIGSLLYSKFEEDVKRILSLLGGRGE